MEFVETQCVSTFFGHVASPTRAQGALNCSQAFKFVETYCVSTFFEGFGCARARARGGRKALRCSQALKFVETYCVSTFLLGLPRARARVHARAHAPASMRARTLARGGSGARLAVWRLWRAPGFPGGKKRRRSYWRKTSVAARWSPSAGRGTFGVGGLVWGLGFRV